jgi:hypothetical protein
MTKTIGILFQWIGLLYFLIFPVGGVALELYTLQTGVSSAFTDLGNAITVLSFLGAVPLGLFVIGLILTKRATGTYFVGRALNILAKIVIVPISMLLAGSLAIITVPYFAYRYYQYRKGLESGVVRFVKWAYEDWSITVPLFVTLVLGTFFILLP